eukprot:scaffold41353_cov18-Prasinocladus_malaysianus.AAC.2
MACMPHASVYMLVSPLLCFPGWQHSRLHQLISWNSSMHSPLSSRSALSLHHLAIDVMICAAMPA